MEVESAFTKKTNRRTNTCVKVQSAKQASASHMNSRFPTLYQINTRVLLTDLARTLQRPATFDDVPESELDRIAQEGFDWVWFLGVWQTGAAGRKISLEDPGLRREYHDVLPDFTDLDVCGSC